jgi:serine/threonine-protein kinase
MAEVYVATRAGPHGFNKRFAIKLILPQLAQDARFVQMFCDEARICAALTHPNIVQVVDFGESDGNLFMAMEYVDGISCAKLLRAVAARGERFPLASALFIAHEVLRALTFAHEALDELGRPLRIVHRDVSPGNILIGRAGEVKLTDFGIVRSSFIDRRTYPGELKGKMGYMSPEQVIGGELDARSDLFTVGIVLAEMLLCRPLFPGRNELDILSRIFEADLRVLERYGSQLTPELLTALRTALSREPNARFQSARDFAEALRAVARQAGASLDEGDLAPWLANLGILASRSGVREAVSVPNPPRSTRPAPRPVLPPSGTVRAVRRPLARTEPPPSSSHFATAPASSHLAARPGARFKIQTGSGNVIGPLTSAQLFELIATGRVTRGTLVSADGVHFHAAAEDALLGRLINRPAFDFLHEDTSRIAWQRRIQRDTLPAQLYELVARRDTGLMVLKGERQQKNVYFSAGVPSFITSNDRSELLGARLVAAGIVPKAAIDACLALRDGPERLGETLIHHGYLRPTTLLRALIEQLEQRFTEIGSWTHGHVCFYRGEQSGEEQLKPHTTGAALVTRLVREGYTGAELAELLGDVRGETLVQAVDGPIAVADLGLTNAERYALELAPHLQSPERLTAQLARENVASPAEGLRAVFIGLASGVLSTPRWVGS